jgi:L-seryl-tRNA(Ser) seleniumtransferase
MQSQYRTIPAIHRLLALPAMIEAIKTLGRPPVMAACRSAVDDLRRRIAEGEIDDTTLEAAMRGSREPRSSPILERNTGPAYREVINATGILIHTNLGRSPLPVDALGVLDSYLALEFDLDTGQRGQRLAPLRQRIADVCGSEAAVMVNNNAAALLLILSTVAQGREVIVSRSQLIEIGGSFRLPDVMAASGCRLVEVGCTNRTHLADFERAIGDDTAAIWWPTSPTSASSVSPPNRRPPSSPSSPTDRGLPLIVDQGSGCLYDLRQWGLPAEETVGELLADGADLVCFSGDKLLGGPQAGIIVGSREWVEPLGRHPLYRALRPDKTALSSHGPGARRAPRRPARRDPALRDDVGHGGEAEGARPTDRRPAAQTRRPARGRQMRAALGGGTTPEETLASYGLAIAGGQSLSTRLRAAATPVIGRLEDDEVLLDLRSVRSGSGSNLEAACPRLTGRRASPGLGQVEPQDHRHREKGAEGQRRLARSAAGR